MELFYRGRTLMLRDNRAALLEAKTSLEQAVLDDPGNVLALATLSELYNAMASRKLGALDLQRQSIYLIEEAERQEIYQAEVLRARSTFLIFSGNPAEGAAVAEKALEITPEDPTLHYLLGLAAEADASAEAGAAEAAFGRVLELDEGFHRIYFERGRSAELAGDLGGALREFQRQLAVEPASPSTHARMGDIYARLGQLDAAVRHCDSAVTLDSHDADAVIQRAVLAYLLDAVLNEHGSGLLNAQRREVKVHLAAARRLSGQPSAAISLLDEVLEDDSGFEPAHFHRGLALLTQGDANRAYDSLVNAESSSVDSFERARVLFHVGRAAAASGQNAEAIDAFGRSLDFDGDFLPSYLWRSGIHLSQRDPETAARLLLDHERTDPLEYRRTQLLTLYYEPLPDLEPVIERMLLALEAKPFAPHLTAALGVVLFHANRDAEARKVCQRAAEMDDRALLPHFYLALLDARNGRGRDARRRMEKLVEKSHNIGIHHAVLGNLHLKAGQPEAALAALERSVAYGLRSSWAFGNLAETLVALGKTKEAGQKLEEALRLEDPAAIALEAKVRLGL